MKQELQEVGSHTSSYTAVNITFRGLKSYESTQIFMNSTKCWLTMPLTKILSGFLALSSD